MGFYQDNLQPFFKKKELSFIESHKEADNVYSFLFEKPKDLTWKAGQYGVFTITHQKIKNNTKPFSVSSSPAENVVRFTTIIRDEPSDFKKALLALKQGMKIIMRGPVGPFYLKDNSPALLIAGGIGVTPFRSMLKQIEAEGGRGDQAINLIYMDSQKSYIFKDELDGVAQNTSINVIYLDSRDNLHQEIDKFTALHKDNSKYFIAGSKSMTDSISVYLLNNHISKKNIIKDSFRGY